MRRHEFAKTVYLLGQKSSKNYGADIEVESYSIHGMLSRIGPDDGLVHYPADLDGIASEDGSEWTLCAQRADDEWPLLYGCLVDCPECGATLVRRGEATQMDRKQGLGLAEAFATEQAKRHE